MTKYLISDRRGKRMLTIVVSSLIKTTSQLAWTQSYLNSLKK